MGIMVENLISARSEMWFLIRPHPNEALATRLPYRDRSADELLF